MKIIRRGFGEKFALLECEDGSYFHLPLESHYIPHVGQTFEPYSGGRFCVFIACPDCDYVSATYTYKAQEDPHELKEIV